MDKETPPSLQRVLHLYSQGVTRTERVYFAHSLTSETLRSIAALLDSGERERVTGKVLEELSCREIAKRLRELACSLTAPPFVKAREGTPRMRAVMRDISTQRQYTPFVIS